MSHAAHTSHQAVRVTESYLNSVKRGEGQGTIDIKIYCKLGHLHLLLENYARGEEIRCSLIFYNSLLNL